MRVELLGQGEQGLKVCDGLVCMGLRLVGNGPNDDAGAVLVPLVEFADCPGMRFASLS